MQRFLRLRFTNYRVAFLALIAVSTCCLLLLHKLGSLVGGINEGEQSVIITPLGWHGIYHNPLYLPLDAVRSALFYFFTDHTQALVRLPNALFGLLSVVAFAWLVRVWHGRRTGILAGALFATAAWTLHVSRLASFDVMYLWVTTILLLTYAKLQRDFAKAWVFYGSLLVWGLVLYVPGVIWFLLLTLYASRRGIGAGWHNFSRWWQRALYVLAGAIWLPLLIKDLRNTVMLREWLGLPMHLASVPVLLKNFAGVFVHLFMRGPQYPQLWLGKAPLLDVFTLAVCLIGIYFYARHLRAGRSRLLASMFFIGAVLVALGGAVSLSALVPLMYLFAAAGIAYLSREWLRTFPLNPLARMLGVGLIVVAVALACVYNLRAYYIAWPHNAVTPAVFRYHLQR